MRLIYVSMIILLGCGKLESDKFLSDINYCQKPAIDDLISDASFASGVAYSLPASDPARARFAQRFPVTSQSIYWGALTWLSANRVPDGPVDIEVLTVPQNGDFSKFPATTAADGSASFKVASGTIEPGELTITGQWMEIEFSHAVEALANDALFVQLVPKYTTSSSPVRVGVKSGADTVYNYVNAWVPTSNVEGSIRLVSCKK